MTTDVEIQYLSELMQLEVFELTDTADRLSLWTLLWSDLKHKIREVSDENGDGSAAAAARVEIMAKAALSRLVAERLITNEELLELQARTKSRPAYDLLICTPLEVEYQAVETAITLYPGCSWISDRERSLNGVGVREALVPKGDGGFFKIALAKVGRARNVHMALLCRKLFEAANVQMCILIGMAGGREDDVKLGDVVAASYVSDYQGGAVVALPNGGVRVDPETEQQPIPDVLVPMLEGFRPLNDNNRPARIKAVKQLADKGWNVPPRAEDEFEFHFKVIASGETVRRDRKLQELAGEVTRRAAAIEMESTGFVHACVSSKVPFAIFRGIADYQDPQKSKEWQPVASVNAAFSALSFIVNKLDLHRL